MDRYRLPARVRRILALSIYLGFCVIAASAQATTFRYLERFGEEESIGIYKVEKLPGGANGDPFLSLEYDNPVDRHVIVLDRSLSTLSWDFATKDGRTKISARRSGGLVTAEGVRGGKLLRIQKDIGSLPWYQAIDYQLAVLAPRPAGSAQTFWMILPTDISFNKMKAVTRPSETIELLGKSWDAEKVRLTVDGLPEAIWHSDYWYEKGTGLYLRFKGRRGPPWTPTVSLELLSID
jgi:hypothetical protein